MFQKISQKFSQSDSDFYISLGTGYNQLPLIEEAKKLNF